MLECETVPTDPSHPNNELEGTRALGVTALLMAFDGHHRPGDPTKIRTEDLQPPILNQTGVANDCSTTLFPASRELRSKTGLQSNTFVIGGAHPRRQWLTRVASALKLNAVCRAFLYALAKGQLENCGLAELGWST